MKEIAPFRAEQTIYEKRRKLRLLERVFTDLKEQGLIESANPKCFDNKTIGAFLKWTEKQGHSPVYVVTLLNHLGGLLLHVENAVIESLRKKGLLSIDPGPTPIIPKDEQWLHDALQRLEGYEDWDHTVIRFAVQVYFYTGLRPKELRMAKLADLDTAVWFLTVSAPKGMRRWTSGKDRILVMNELRPVFQDFLFRRERHLEELGLESEALIPNILGGFYNGATWNMLRYRVFKDAGIQGNFPLLRPSFAMERKKEGNNVEDVSRMLRHTSVVTTQKFYAQMESAEVWARASQKRMVRVKDLNIRAQDME